MKCVKCGHNYCDMTSDTKKSGRSYSFGGDILGEALFGPAGYCFSFSDSYKVDVDVFWICKKCGHKFKA